MIEKMKISKNILIHFATTCMLLGLSLLQSCGTESDLSFATRKLILSSELFETPSRTNEYIVAFKTDSGYQGKWISPKNENRYNTIYLSSALMHQASTNDFQMLGRVPMNKLETKQNPIHSNFLYTQPSQVSKQPEDMVLVNIKFRSNDEAKAKLEQWSKEDAIWFAEPNYINETFQNPYTQHLADYETATGGTPQWYHSQIKLLEAFGELSNADMILEPIIAVLDWMF